MLSSRCKTGAYGKTALHLIQSSVKEARTANRRIQPAFWSGVKMRYRQCIADRPQLEVLDRNQSINPRLSGALDAMNSGSTAKKNVQDLVFFKTAS